MRDRRIALGALLGVVLAAAMLCGAARSRPASPPEPLPGPLLSECRGALKELVIQYVPEAAAISAPVYREFLPQLPASVTVHVLCPDRAAFEDLTARVGTLTCRLNPVLTSHAMTTWSRDRWLALEPPASGSRVTLLAPREESGAAVWPQRAGDARVAEDLAAASPHLVRARRTPFYFDGGDFLTDGQTIFVTPAVLRRNLRRTVETREELERTLAEMLGRRVTLLDDAPDHHAAMFMMLTGGRTALVGDPALAARLLSGGAGAKRPDGEAYCPCGDDFTPETQRLFDRVAEQVSAAGYGVVRIPTVPGEDGRTFLTYVNVLLDERDGRRIVYLPVYRHVPALNAAAAEVWRGLGFEVRPVDCTPAYAHFGTLHCLVNVLRRAP